MAGTIKGGPSATQRDQMLIIVMINGGWIFIYRSQSTGLCAPDVHKRINIKKEKKNCIRAYV